MITEKDLHEAIAECQGERNPNASTCMKLAAYYIILDHVKEKEPSFDGYSHDAYPAEVVSDVVLYDGNSDFAKAISGMNSIEAWSLMDELMDAVMVTNPPLYNSVMRRLL